MRKSLQEIICDKILNVPWYKRMEVLRVMYGWTMKEASGLFSLASGSTMGSEKAPKIIVDLINILMRL